MRPSRSPVRRRVAARRLPALLALPLAALFVSACTNIQAATDDLGALPGQPRAVLTGDFDGDGRPDALYGYGGDYLGLTAVREDGYGFWRRTDLGGMVIGSELLAKTDVDGDGALDVIAAARSLDRFTVLRNRGDGTFTASTKEISPLAPGTTRITALTSATAASGTRLVSVAYETDDPDAFVRPRSVVTYRASGGGLSNANTFQLFDPVPGDARVLRLHDVDGDGRLDLLIGTATGTVQIYRGSGGDGSFATAPTTLSVPGRSAAVAALAVGDVRTIEEVTPDWALDGRADLLVSFADGGDVHGFRGGAGGTFGAAESMGVINGPASGFAELAILPGSGGWGGLMKSGPVAAFAQTSGGYGIARVKVGDNVVCNASAGALFPNSAAQVPFAAVVACRVPSETMPRAVVTVPLRARLKVPASVALGSVRAGTNGAVETVGLSPVDMDRVAGLSSGYVGIRSVRIEGPDAGDFELVRGELGPCFAPHLPEEEPCRPQVRFAPRSPGPKAATLVVDSDAYRAAGTPAHSIALSGTGTGAAAKAPATVALGDVAWRSSASAPLTISNTGNEPLTPSLTLEDAGAGWTVSPGTCASAVAPGGSCSATVRYAPPAVGAVTASLRVGGNGVGAAPLVALSARGVGSGVTALPVSFGPVAVGSSAGGTASIVNSGAVALQISAVAAAGPDAARVTVDASDCTGAPVAAGGSCDVGLTFAPGARGALDATLQVTSNAPSSPNVVALSGNGLQGRAAAPAELALGTVRVGSFGERELTVENDGDAPLRLGALAVEGAATLRDDGCSAAILPVGGDCTVTVRFAPLAAGAVTGVVRIPSDGEDGERAVALTGLALPVEEEPGGPCDPARAGGAGDDPCDPGRPGGPGGPGDPGGPGGPGDPGGPVPPGPGDPCGAGGASGAGGSGGSGCPGGPGGPGGDRRLAARAALTLTAPPRATVRRGGTVRLKLRLRSTGAQAVERATARVALPAALRWQPPRSARGRRAAPRPTRTVLVKVGRLAPGTARTVTLTLRAAPRARRAPLTLTLRATAADGVTARATTVIRVR